MNRYIQFLLIGLLFWIISDSAGVLVVAWLNGTMLVSINKVTLRRTQLVLGWVTVCGRVNHIGLWPATQANSAFYPQWDGKWVPAKVRWRSAAGE